MLATEARQVHPREGLSSLFTAAFEQSRNAMVLLDSRRRHVDANAAYVALLRHPRKELIGRPIYSFVSGGPLATPREWRDHVSAGRFTGEAELVSADGTLVAVQYAATSEVVTGRYLVLFVAMSTSRWGRHFRRPNEATDAHADLSKREREIVRLVSLGSTGPEIADELLISHDTVRTHVRNAMTKLDARSRAHLVAKALAEGVALG
jgi:DNA-binding CsgD family transcriptional regulator